MEQPQLPDMQQTLSLLLQHSEAMQLQNQELQQQLREMKVQLNSGLSTIPILVREEMQEFIRQYKEERDNQKPSEMAESIKCLVKVMEALEARLGNSELIHAQVDSSVVTAAEEIRDFKNRLLKSDLAKLMNN